MYLLIKEPQEIKNPYAVYSEGSLVEEEVRLLALIVHNKFHEGVDVVYASSIKIEDLDTLAGQWRREYPGIGGVCMTFSDYLKEHIIDDNTPIVSTIA